MINENVTAVFLICFRYWDNMKTFIMPASYYKLADKLYQINKVNRKICYGISKISDD